MMSLVVLFALGCGGSNVVAVTPTQVGDAGLGHLSRLASLQVLDLANAQVSDAGLAHLTELTSLERLSLANTQVGDGGAWPGADACSVRLPRPS